MLRSAMRLLHLHIETVVGTRLRMCVDAGLGALATDIWRAVLGAVEQAATSEDWLRAIRINRRKGRARKRARCILVAEGTN